jgi:hypothetical protein
MRTQTQPPPDPPCPLPYACHRSPLKWRDDSVRLSTCASPRELGYRPNAMYHAVCMGGNVRAVTTWAGQMVY